MMFSSLRTRLWLSYALLIVVLLVIVAVGLVVAFLQTPRLLYPEIVFRLRLFSETVPADDGTGAELPAGVSGTCGAKLPRAIFAWCGLARTVRLSPIPAGRICPLTASCGPRNCARWSRTRCARCASAAAGVWLYMLRRLPDGSPLLMMASAPGLPLAAVP